MEERQERFVLSAPTPEGNAFWSIQDMKEEFALVSISIHFPGAEAEARALMQKLIDSV